MDSMGIVINAYDKIYSDRFFMDFERWYNMVTSILEIVTTLLQ